MHETDKVIGAVTELIPTGKKVSLIKSIPYYGVVVHGLMTSNGSAKYVAHILGSAIKNKAREAKELGTYDIKVEVMGITYYTEDDIFEALTKAHKQAQGN